MKVDSLREGPFSISSGVIHCLNGCLTRAWPSLTPALLCVYCCVFLSPAFSVDYGVLENKNYDWLCCPAT